MIGMPVSDNIILVCLAASEVRRGWGVARPCATYELLTDYMQVLATSLVCKDEVIIADIC